MTGNGLKDPDTCLESAVKPQSIPANLEKCPKADRRLGGPMIRVRVPATTANMGPGYDVLGMALSQYSTFQCQEDDKISLFYRWD